MRFSNLTKLRISPNLFALTAAALLPISAYGGSKPEAGGDERCLSLAKYGFEVATSKSLGLTEERIKEVSRRAVPSAIEADLRRTQNNVITYIFTVDLRAEDARKVIFAKCKAGDFYGIK